MDRQTAHEVMRKRLASLSAEFDYHKREADRIQIAMNAAEAFLQSDADPEPDYSGIDFLGQSMHRSLVQIAERNGGTVVTREVTGVFVQAGLYTSRDAANIAIHDVLQGSKEFAKVGTGVYAKVHSVTTSTNGQMTSESPSKILVTFLREGRKLNKSLAVDALREAGYDFGSKNQQRVAGGALRQALRAFEKDEKRDTAGIPAVSLDL